MSNTDSSSDEEQFVLISTVKDIKVIKYSPPLNNPNLTDVPNSNKVKPKKKGIKYN